MTTDSPIQSQRLATAQAAVLGAMLIDADCIADVLADTSEAMFVSSVYRTVYGCIRQLFQEAQPVDPVTVGAALKERAGQDYGELLVQLMDVTPTSANVGSYVEILKRESIVWRLRSIGAALAETEDLPAAEKLMEKANAAMSLKSGVEVWDMTQMWENFCQRHAQTAKTEYIRWGYDFIDERVYTARGDYCVIGGYPSAGKTCLALGMAMKMAERYRVGFFSYETDKAKLADRIMSARAMIDLSDIKKNKLGEKEWEELAYAASSLSRTGLQIMQCSGFTVADIQSVALSRHYDVVFVDYLQLIEADGLEPSGGGQLHQPRLAADEPRARHHGGGAVPADAGRRAEEDRGAHHVRPARESADHHGRGRHFPAVSGGSGGPLRGARPEVRQEQGRTGWLVQSDAVSGPHPELPPYAEAGGEGGAASGAGQLSRNSRRRQGAVLRGGPMQTGDKVTYVPFVLRYAKDTELRAPSVTVSVVWVHPERRFAVVERSTGRYRYRECIPCRKTKK